MTDDYSFKLDSLIQRPKPYKDEGANEISPAQAKGLIKSPSIIKLAENFEIAPSTSGVKRTTRGNKIKTPEKVSPGKEQEVQASNIFLPQISRPSAQGSSQLRIL